MATETDAKPIFLEPPPIISAHRIYNYEVTETKAEVASQEDAKKFTEREQYAIDKFEYPRNGSDPGLVLIFNQENFEHLKPRRGSRRDVNEIVICLQRQGFNIEKNNILSDCNRDEITAKLKEVSRMDLSEKNCLIIFFLTHGDEFDRLHTFDGTMTTNEIWSNFSNCKDLQNKPKMFVFQACKGDSFSTTMDTKISQSSPSCNIVPYSTFSAKYMGPDMLVVYSTIEGNVSFRNALTGSWFIQELCKNFNSYGKRDDVASLIIRATKCVCGNYFHYEDNVDKKQMPMFVSTLTKKFFLNRNKDRAILLKVRDSNEEIIKLLNNVKEKVNKIYLKEEEKRQKKKEKKV